MRNKKTPSSRRVRASQGGAAWVGWKREDSENLYQNLSHVLRTPLIGMRGYVEYLLCGYTGTLSQEQTKCLERARESSIKLEGHIEVLMDLLAFQLKLVPDQRETIAFGELWEGWALIMVGIAKARGAKVKVEPFLREARVRVDRKWTKMFWVKFVEALCDTLPGRKGLRLRAERRGERVLISLSGRWGVAWDLLKHWGSVDLLGVHMDDHIKRMNVFRIALAREILSFYGGELKIRASKHDPGAGEILIWLPCSSESDVSKPRGRSLAGGRS